MFTSKVRLPLFTACPQLENFISRRFLAQRRTWMRYFSLLSKSLNCIYAKKRANKNLEENQTISFSAFKPRRNFIKFVPFSLEILQAVPLAKDLCQGSSILRANNLSLFNARQLCTCRLFFRGLHEGQLFVLSFNFNYNLS